MYIDTHCHLNFEAFADDWQKVADEAVQAGVKKMIVVGADLKSSARAVELADKNQNLFAAIGIHPHHCQDKINIDKLEKLAKNKKVIAIGECGLDYHEYKITKYENSQITSKIKIWQKKGFGQQIQLAKKLSLPMIIHNREAGNDMVDVLDHFCRDDGQYPQGVFHCISGSKKLLKKILELGFYIGVDGNVSYSQEVQTLAVVTPLSRILLETDAPYLSPKHDGSRNIPQSVKIVAEYLSRLKKISVKKIETETSQNSIKLFKFPRV